MEVLQSSFVQGFIRMSEDGWLQGWHECHGGNLSYRLNENDVALVQKELEFSDAWVPLGVELPLLAGEYFMITATGQFMRNITLYPSQVCGIIRINEKGNAYQTVWGLEGGKPTSELVPHLMNHAIKVEVTEGRYRVVYHAHPANIIALSFVLPLNDITFTRQLWEMEPECAMTFPAGMGVLPWLMPGTADTARLTCEKMREYDVVLWAQHGLFVAGDSFDNTFGLLHTVEKAAEMLVKVLSMGGKMQAPTSEDFRTMAAVFHLDLPDKFLFDS